MSFIGNITNSPFIANNRVLRETINDIISLSREALRALEKCKSFAEENFGCCVRPAQNPQGYLNVMDNLNPQQVAALNQVLNFLPPAVTTTSLLHLAAPSHAEPSPTSEARPELESGGSG
jgi:hypothetical protein